MRVVPCPFDGWGRYVTISTAELFKQTAEAGALPLVSLRARLRIKRVAPGFFLFLRNIDS
jgi:hypothetical protein